MLYIIGFGVIALITIRVVQAGVVENPPAFKAMTVLGAVVGLGFLAWLALHAYMHDTELPPVPRTPPSALPKL